MEEAAAKFDDKFKAMQRIVEEVGGEMGKEAWRKALSLMGVEEEIEEEEEEEEGTEEEMKQIERKMIIEKNGEEEKEVLLREKLMELIEAEARNHATILYILKAVEKLNY